MTFAYHVQLAVPVSPSNLRNFYSCVAFGNLLKSTLLKVRRHKCLILSESILSFSFSNNLLFSLPIASVSVLVLSDIWGINKLPITKTNQHQKSKLTFDLLNPQNTTDRTSLLRDSEESDTAVQRHTHTRRYTHNILSWLVHLICACTRNKRPWIHSSSGISKSLGRHHSQRSRVQSVCDILKS